MVERREKQPRGKRCDPRTVADGERDDGADAERVENTDRERGTDEVEQRPREDVVDRAAREHPVVGYERPKVAGEVREIVEERKADADADEGEGAGIDAPEPEGA